MSVPATRLYTSHGIAWPATMTAVLATIAVGTIVISSPRPRSAAQSELRSPAAG